MIKDVLTESARISNEVLGVICEYEHSDGSITSNVLITINVNKEQKGDFGMVVQSYVEATILKSDVSKVRRGEKFTDDEGVVWEVSDKMKETSSKHYVAIKKL